MREHPVSYYVATVVSAALSWDGLMVRAEFTGFPAVSVGHQFWVRRELARAATEAIELPEELARRWRHLLGRGTLVILVVPGGSLTDIVEATPDNVREIA